MAKKKQKSGKKRPVSKTVAASAKKSSVSVNKSSSISKVTRDKEKQKYKTQFKRHKTVKKHKDASDQQSDSEFEEVSAKLVNKSRDPMPEDEDSDGASEVADTRKLVARQNRKKKKSGGFQSFGLSHAVYNGVIRKGYKVPTPIQRKTIPTILEGKDMVAMARTGSGKTAAFLIPMFELLKTHSAKAGARALIMSPTRELALQTLKFTKELGKFTGIRAAVILGGDRMEDQFAALHNSPDIIIATPGRFMHVMVEMNLKLKSVEYVVFDEADRLFEMGFQEQLTEIIHRLPETRQTLLFSATLPKLLVEFAKAGLHDPTLIRLDVDTKLSENLKMSFLSCRADDKSAVLLHLLQHTIAPSEQTVVFAATKHHVEYINMLLQKAGISSTYIYSSLDQSARKINVAKFQHKKVMVLVVTDLAARGIDIPLLDNVINYNFPAKPKLFVHRVGRVARAGRLGTAFSLVSGDEVAHLFDLHVFLGRAFKVMPANNTQPDENGLYGSVPQSLIDDMESNLLVWHKESVDLENMKKVCSNAYKQYIRSRPAPASESIKRVKEFDKDGVQMGIHPVFGSQYNNEEEERMKLLNSLKSYKSGGTIFEVNSTTKKKGFEVMKKKRLMHGQVISSKQQRIQDRQEVGLTKADDTVRKQEAADDADVQSTFSVVIGSRRLNTEMPIPSKKKRSLEIRDEENYLSYRPPDFQTEKGLSLDTSFHKQISGAVLDLTGDEETTMRKMGHQMKWDRKRKRFVKDAGEDGKSKKIRTESGAWISSSYKSNAYKEWKHRNQIGEGGEEADDDRSADDGATQLSRLKVLGTMGKRWHTQGAEVESDGKSKSKHKYKPAKRELKRPEQIMKARTIKARKQALQHHQQQKKKKQKAIHNQKSKKRS